TETVELAKSAYPRTGGKITGDIDASGWIGASKLYERLENGEWGPVGRQNTASLEQSGWWKCGDKGFYIQWGYTKGSLGEEHEWVQFPIRFPTVCFGGLATVTLTSSIVGTLSAYFGGPTQEGAWVTVDQSRNAYDKSFVFWFAIGY
ncbi:hypothetical protein ABLB90_23900, partial [Photorhabdus bodei]|uniref:gp53-like domain-containing protein n=1 Tax=Photorhabdus bodei TaxID=2029681 RepID=UPI0032BDFE1F